jgi:hypothetical protein
MTYIVDYLKTFRSGMIIITVHLPYHDLRCGQIRYRESCMTLDFSGLVVRKLSSASESGKPHFRLTAGANQMESPET